MDNSRTKEYILPKRFEGKSLRFKWKYLWANFPEIGLLCVGAGVICPIILAYEYFTYEFSRDKAIRKYKFFYTVVRDDDPKVPKIIQQKNLGKHLFPK